MFVAEGATAVSAMVAEQGEIERLATGCARRLFFEWRGREKLFQCVLSGVISPIGDLCLEGLMEISALRWLAVKSWS
jgi:hypothetical protein